MIQVYVKFSEVAGSVVPLDQIHRTLGRFDIDQVVLILTRINLFLRKHDQSQPKIQQKLAEDLLNRNLLVNLRACQQGSFARTGEYRPVLTIQMILIILKEALIYHSLKGKLDIDSERFPKEFKQLGQILFGFSDHFASRTMGQYPKNADLEALGASEFIRNWLLLRRDEFRHLLVRYYRILLSFYPTVDLNLSGYKNFEELFQAASGIPLSVYFGIGAVLVAHFAQADCFDASKNPTEDPNKYCSIIPPIKFDDVNVDSDEAQKTLDALSINIQEARSALKRYEDAGEIDSNYNVLPFIDKPLLKLEKGALCVADLQMLQEKITSGIFWIVSNFLLSDRKAGNRFRIWWGDVFHAYVSSIFKDKLLTKIEDETLIPIIDKRYGKSEERATDVMIVHP